MKTKLRILFLHEVNYLDKPIFEMHEFPELLSGMGHAIGFSHFPEGWTAKDIRKQGWKSSISGRSDPSTTLTLYTPQLFSTSFLGRLFFSISSFSEAIKTLNDFKPDIVVSYSVPTSGWQMLLACRVLGIPFVFRAIDVSHQIRRTRLSTLVRFAEAFVYRKAASVSANNPALRDYVIEHGGKASSVLVHLPPLDLVRFKSSNLSPRDLREGLGISRNARVILYMGTFFYFSGLDEVLERLAHFKSSDWVLVLVGGGEERLNLERLVEDLELAPKVKFTGFVDFDSLSSYLKIADVAINPMRILAVSNYALPNKVLQYLASGVPVVSTRLAGLRSLVGEPCVSFAESPANVADLALEVLEQSDKSSQLNIESAVAQFDQVLAAREFETYLIRVAS